LAGATATTANRNIALGYGSYGGTGVKQGALNIAIGNNALAAATTGSFNIAIGDGALPNITTGERNFGMGTNAGLGITTGSDNMIFGTSTVTGSNRSYITTLGQGTVIGQSYLVAIGGIASNAAKNGVVIGHGAGISGGNNNIRLGASDQSTFTATMSGNNNILIGGAAKLPDSTASNQITFYTNANDIAAGGVSGGYNVLTRFNGGQWLFNNTAARVSTATASALLEVNGTTGGVLLPRLTASQRTGIASPASGLILTDTDSTNRPFVYNGSAWKGLAYTDQLPSIDTLTSTLLADVAMASANTWYSGPSVTLPVGTWLVMGHLSHAGGAANANLAVRIDGTTASAGAFSAASRQVTVSCNAIVNVASGTTTLTLQANCSTTTTNISFQSLYQSQAGATRIIAVKIK
jgi:hypothetical protein